MQVQVRLRERSRVDEASNQKYDRLAPELRGMGIVVHELRM